MYYLVLHLSLTKCESHRRILTADFRTEIEIPTSTSMRKTYYLKPKEMHTRRWNIHFSYAFIWKHLSICTTAFRFRYPPPPGTLPLDPGNLHAEFNFRLAKPQYFTLFSLYTSSNCPSICLYTGRTGALKISNISLYQAIVWHCI